MWYRQSNYAACRLPWQTWLISHTHYSILSSVPLPKSPIETALQEDMRYRARLIEEMETFSIFHRLFYITHLTQTSLYATWLSTCFAAPSEPIQSFGAQRAVQAARRADAPFMAQGLGVLPRSAASVNMRPNMDVPLHLLFPTWLPRRAAGDMQCQ